MCCSIPESNPRSHSRTKFTPREDAIIQQIVGQKGAKDWRSFERYLPGRTARQIRERYINYLSPHTRKGDWTDYEDTLLRSMVLEHGRKWSQIAMSFEGRTDVMIKNRWIKLERRAASNKPQKSQNKDPLPVPEIETEQRIHANSVDEQSDADAEPEVQILHVSNTENWPDILDYI